MSLNDTRDLENEVLDKQSSHFNSKEALYSNDTDHVEINPFMHTVTETPNQNYKKDIHIDLKTATNPLSLNNEQMKKLMKKIRFNSTFRSFKHRNNRFDELNKSKESSVKSRQYAASTKSQDQVLDEYLYQFNTIGSELNEVESKVDNLFSNKSNLGLAVRNALIKKFLKTQQFKSQYRANLNRRALNWRHQKQRKAK